MEKNTEKKTKANETKIPLGGGWSRQEALHVMSQGAFRRPNEAGGVMTQGSAHPFPWLRGCRAAHLPPEAGEIKKGRSRGTRRESPGQGGLAVYWEIIIIILIIIILMPWMLGSVLFSSVTLLCPTLCDPMDCSTPGLSVHRQLPEFTQTHVHWVGDAIQPSHPLSSPSPPALYLSQHH